MERRRESMKRKRFWPSLPRGRSNVETATKMLEEADQARPRGQLYCKVSEKGGMSLYGLQRMPVTLYIEQWERLLAFGEEIATFLKEHDAELKRKAEVAAWPLLFRRTVSTVGWGPGACTAPCISGSWRSSPRSPRRWLPPLNAISASVAAMPSVRRRFVAWTLVHHQTFTPHGRTKVHPTFSSGGTRTKQSGPGREGMLG